MFALIHADDLCCVSFTYPAVCMFQCPEMVTNTMCWAQLSRLFILAGRGVHLRNVDLNKTSRRVMSENQ
jgi:hypothetical protein